MSQKISVHGPDQLLTVLPYQLGYHPRRSVVAVALADRRVHFVARVDIPPDRYVPETVAALVGPLRREASGPVHLVGYEDTPDASGPLLLALVEELESGGTEVAEVFVVRDGRRYSPTCSRPCCPPEGVALPPPEAVPAVAELVALGRAPLADRDAVAGLVEAHDPVAGEVGRRLGVTTGPPRRRRETVRAWAALLDREQVERGDSPRPDLVARAVAGLRDVTVRDTVIAWLAPGVIPRDALDPVVLTLCERWLPRWGGMGRWGASDREAGERDAVLARLLALCRCVPDDRPDDAAAVCTTAAHVAWAGGDGAVTRSALDRALRVEPGYRLARLLARLVEHGLRLDRPPASPGALERAG